MGSAASALSAETQSAVKKLPQGPQKELLALYEDGQQLQAENDKLKAELAALRGGGKADKEAEAPLPPDLAAFEPILKMAKVKEAASGLKELEAAFAQAPKDKAGELKAKTDAVSATLKEMIDTRVKEEGVVKKCDAAIDAGADVFTAVYDAVNHSIDMSEADGIKALHAELSQERLKARVGCGGADAKQRSAALLDVYADAAAARPQATAIIRRLAKSCGVETPAAEMALKGTLRIMEKSLLRPHPGDDAQRGGCERVCDIVRDMLVSKAATQLAQLVKAFLDEAELVVVRVKDRFQNPSAGGWRDILINYYVKADANKHVCEVQIVHNSLLAARTGLSGHDVYNIVRNASELLERIGLLDKGGRDAGLKALMKAGWSMAELDKVGCPMLVELPGHTDGVTAVFCLKDGKHVLTGDGKGKIRLWGTADGALVRELQPGRERILSLVVSDDGEWAVAGWRDKVGAHVYSLGDGKIAKKIRCGNQGCPSLCFTADGTHLITSALKDAAAFDHTDGKMSGVGMKDPFPSPPVVSYECGGDSWQTALCCTADNQLLLTGDHNGVVKVFQRADGTHARDLEGHSGERRTASKRRPGSRARRAVGGVRISQICCTADSKKAVTACCDLTARLWQIATGSLLRTITHDVPVCLAALDKLIVTGTERPGKVLVWNLLGKDDDKPVTALCATRDGQCVVSGGAEHRSEVCKISLL